MTTDLKKINCKIMFIEKLLDNLKRYRIPHEYLLDKIVIEKDDIPKSIKSKIESLCFILDDDVILK
jgi:hypothetical protein